MRSGPLTCSFVVGPVVPMPTLPPACTLNRLSAPKKPMENRLLVLPSPACT